MGLRMCIYAEGDRVGLLDGWSTDPSPHFSEVSLGKLHIKASYKHALSWNVFPLLSNSMCVSHSVVYDSL